MLESADYLRRAREMERAADRAIDSIAKADFRLAAQQWRRLAATAARAEGHGTPRKS